MSSLRTLAVLVLSLGLGSSLAFAQDEEAPSDPVIKSLEELHLITATNVALTAEMLDDAMYAYQPSDSVRTAGQLLAHIATAQYVFCSAAAGQDNPNPDNFEMTATSKPEIVAALGEAMAYCGGVYDAMTDAQGAEMRDFFGTPMAASGILAFNSAHTYEHYGNLVTYMRINDIVPPSSMR